MNQTRQRGYPFPQCDPPYVKDAADAPAQLKALALSVEADIADLDDQIQEAAFPPAVLISNIGVTQNLAPDARFDLTTLEYGPSAMFDNANDAILIGANGLYWITAWAQTNAMTTDFARLAIHRNTTTSIIARDNRLPNQQGVAGQVKINAHGITILTAGDRVFLTQSHDDATAPWTDVRLGCAMLTEL